MQAAQNNNSISSKVLRRIRRWGRGSVFVPRDLLDIGSRAAIDITLHRLEDQGTIRRLGRGIYDYPKIHDRLGPLSPSVDKIARALARSHNSIVVRPGAAAANSLGISTQVPSRATYLTDSSTRVLKVGGRKIRFTHASPARLLGGDSPAGTAIRALRHLGKNNITPELINRLRNTLGEDDKKHLDNLKPDTPDWIRKIIDQLMNQSMANQT